MSVDFEILESFRQRLLDRYDVLELVELLGITAEELLDAFQDKVLELHDEET